jgi:multidrug efflux pump subunit AcrB
MNLTTLSLNNRVVTYFCICLVMLAGTASFFALGQLEDPEFTVRAAVVTTSYPGASPLEVEQEVTDRIELAIQEMHEIDYIESFSRAGFSLISVNIKSEYWADRLPQVWDQLRRKVRDVESTLPPGAGRPQVADDFGDVYGFQLVLAGDGFSYKDIEKYAKDVKKALSLVSGVARVDLWGNQTRMIYLDVSQSQLSQFGLTNADISATLAQQNMVVNGGSVDQQERRLRIAPTGEFKSPKDIGDLLIRPSTSTTSGQSPELIRIKDIGVISEGYLSPPPWLMRSNGRPAICISITNVAGLNIVDLGKAIDVMIDELIPTLPVGIELSRMHWQSDVVNAAVGSFLISFAEAVLIVLVVLTVFMGWRMGLIIGASLVCTIMASFILMAMAGIDLQRMSLGALIISLGMMVDNAIVVADGFVVRIAGGMDRRKAADESASTPSLPLLGATIVAVMAFYPIFASTADAGEYCRTLFTVVAIALLLSWVIALTLTPILCLDFMPTPKQSDEKEELSPFFQKFKGVLALGIRFRFLTIGGLVALLLVSFVGFGKLSQQFFPFSSMEKFMVDVWLPEGSRIQTVSEQMRVGEKKLLADERIESVSTFVGQGPPRFYLPVDPESPYQAFGQYIINVYDYKEIDALIAEYTSWLSINLPDSQIVTRKYGVGPSNSWKFELRISGPAEADAQILRSLAGSVEAILKASPLADATNNNWRQRVMKLVPEYNDERARWAGVSREDLANTTQRAFDGREIGLYREDDELLSIVLRHGEEDRRNVSSIDSLQIQPENSTESIPLAQVTDTVFTQWEDSLIWRRDRRNTITVQSNPIPGVTLPTLRDSVLAEIEAIPLPKGYSMEWGGEFEDTVDSQAALIPGIIPAVALMALIIVALFNAMRPPLVILFTLPFIMIGIVAGLLPTGTPFGFLALLGAMSLIGMMIKNAIVLLDQVNIYISEGMGRYEAIIESAVSRLRPVGLAAATTVLGVVPLIQDPFWIGLAITVMSGLTFGTLLTMILVPVLYATLYRLQADAPTNESV